MQADELLRKIKVLNERLWEGKATKPRIDKWLANFQGQVLTSDEEQLHALHLLSHFMYFGMRETRQMLKSLYRDEFRTPLLHAIRRSQDDSLNPVIIEPLYNDELSATRFTGMGSASESGAHLLYYFRQENELAKHQFLNATDILDNRGTALRNSPDAVKRYVFLDDFAGSGDQAVQYSEDIVATIKRLGPAIDVVYYVMIASKEAIDTIKASAIFDDIRAVFVLDQSFRTFSTESRYYKAPSKLNRIQARNICAHYGATLTPGHPFGYSGGGFLLGFQHNTPDNSLPIFWYDEEPSPWTPIFRRYPKHL